MDCGTPDGASSSERSDVRSIGAAMTDGLISAWGTPIRQPICSPPSESSTTFVHEVVRALGVGIMAPTLPSGTDLLLLNYGWAVRKQSC